jgi:hypothetical protein
MWCMNAGKRAGVPPSFDSDAFRPPYNRKKPMMHCGRVVAMSKMYLAQTLKSLPICRD